MLVGSNPLSAEFSGIRVKHVKLFSYMIAGGSALLASIVVSGYVGTVDPDRIGSEMAFESLVAIVLGGNMLGGGKPTVIGALGGALALTLIINIAVLFGFQIQHQYLFKGIILLAVVLMSTVLKNRNLSFGSLISRKQK